MSTGTPRRGVLVSPGRVGGGSSRQRIARARRGSDQGKVRGGGFSWPRLARRAGFHPLSPFATIAPCCLHKAEAAQPLSRRGGRIRQLRARTRVLKCGAYALLAHPSTFVGAPPRMQRSSHDGGGAPTLRKEITAAAILHLGAVPSECNTKVLPTMVRSNMQEVRFWQ